MYRSGMSNDYTAVGDPPAHQAAKQPVAPPSRQPSSQSQPPPQQAFEIHFRPRTARLDWATLARIDVQRVVREVWLLFTV